ncbi:hypothetical protein [Niallia sp. 03133]
MKNHFPKKIVRFCSILARRLDLNEGNRGAIIIFAEDKHTY